MSPNLKVIEMMWAFMDDMISFYQLKNKEELIEVIKIAWNSIDIETINKICSSFVGRCYICIKNYGHYILNDLKKGLKYFQNSLRKLSQFFFLQLSSIITISTFLLYKYFRVNSLVSCKNLAYFSPVTDSSYI